MKINLTPQETFFFRDSRPFDKGNGWATGIFPPLPSTIYGALRTAAISQKSSICDFYSDKPIGIRKEIGYFNHSGDLEIRSQVIASGSTFYIPCPLDLLQKGDKLYPLIPNTEEIVSDMDLKFFKAPDANFSAIDFSQPEIPWIEKYDLEDYLLGKSEMSAMKKPFYRNELKTGIQKNFTTGTAREHMLYVQNMLRMENDNMCFSVDINNCSSLDEKGILRLGHDGRIFNYTLSKKNNFDFINTNVKNQIKDRINQSKCFKLFFTSPTFLGNGWLPKGVEKKNNYEWKVNKQISIQIESVMTGRPMRIGGWKINKTGKGSPKPMNKAIPPGTVYYCKLCEGDADKLFNALFDKNYSDLDKNLSRQGFGHTLIALINH